jgi:sterol 24-C-methyltransferase
MASHREALQHGNETKDYVAGVCNYYSIMSDLITMTSGPYWHFVPMFKGVKRLDCHHKFHHTLAGYVGAKKGEKVLELGCGYGEMGRQVAKITGCNVTGLTMADEEIVGANERIKAAGLEGQCNMVQGNYHKCPFPDASFDKVFGVYTLKYSADLDKVIGEVARCLKKGGKFVSYEILVTDKYDPNNPVHKYEVKNISDCTCMPPLHHAQAFRDAAQRAGLKPCEEIDLCAPPAEQWYSCFERTKIYHVMNFPLLMPFTRFVEFLGLVPRSFSDWFENCLIHPCVDFVNSGRRGTVSGAVMMTWTKA